MNQYIKTISCSITLGLFFPYYFKEKVNNKEIIIYINESKVRLNNLPNLDFFLHNLRYSFMGIISGVLISNLLI